MMVAQIIYITLCLLAMGAIFHVQEYRSSSLWWAYTILTFGLGWEAIDAWKYGAPGWPSSRWVMVPSLTIILVTVAVSEWRQRRRVRRAVQ